MNLLGPYLFLPRPSHSHNSGSGLSQPPTTTEIVILCIIIAIVLAWGAWFLYDTIKWQKEFDEKFKD